MQASLLRGAAGDPRPEPSAGRVSRRHRILDSNRAALAKKRAKLAKNCRPSANEAFVPPC